MFEWIRQEEVIPETWRQERVTLLHKGGSKRELDNYRTIAIGSNIGKLFARIIKNRLQGEDVKVMKEPRWDFKNDQRWDKYRSGLCEALDSWEREAKLGKEVTNDIGVLESAYSNFIEDNIGMKDGRGSRATGKMGKTMSGLVKQRNKAWKNWRQSFKVGGALVLHNWNTFKNLRYRVAQRWRKEKKKAQVKWRIKMLKKVEFVVKRCGGN